MVEQVVQRGCGVSVLGDTKNLKAHEPEQRALANPALVRGVGQDNLHKCLLNSLIL